MTRMSIRCCHSPVYDVLFFAMFGLSVAKEFDRTTCYNTTQTMLESNISMALDTSIFVTNSQGQLMSNANNPWLTISACNDICGSRMGFYSDTPSRLLTWLIPTILLVTNMEFAPIGKERFLMVLHLFGDPIHSTYSFLSKIESWNRWSYFCRVRNTVAHDNSKSDKNRAILMSAVEEVVPSRYMTFYAGQAIACSCVGNNLDEVYRKAANEIINSKTHNISSTCLNIVLYIVGIVSAFIPALGGSTSPSGGKLAPAMLLSWLLPVILLSNVVGQFNSCRDCMDIILRFKERAERLPHAGGCSKTRPLLPDWMVHLDNLNCNDHLDSLAWSGGMYSFRLHSRLPGMVQGHSPLLLAIISVLPVIISFVTAFLVLYSAPTYFSCRHFMIICGFVAWLWSPIITQVIANIDFITDKMRFYSVMLKDAIIAVPILFLLVASSCGLFNNCLCWSGFYTPKHKPAVVLNPVQQFNRNNGVVYPAMVAVSLFLQFCVFAWILWVGRVGLWLM